MDIDDRYKRGKIYRLACTETLDIYIGSTIKTLKKRLRIHRCKGNTCESKYFIDPVIELIELYPCNNRLELRKREQYYIDTNECINKYKSYISEKDRKETDRKYRLDNKEKRNEYNRQYHQDNKEKRKEKRNEYNRQYRLDNKEKIKEKSKEKTICECGIEVTKCNLSRHEKSKFHKNYEKNIIDNINENLQKDM